MRKKDLTHFTTIDESEELRNRISARFGIHGSSTYIDCLLTVMGQEYDLYEIVKLLEEYKTNGIETDYSRNKK